MVSPVSAALICAAVPDSVTVDGTIASNGGSATSGHAHCAVRDRQRRRQTITALSTSATLTPEMAFAVSSGVVCTPGTVFTGASFTGRHVERHRCRLRRTPHRKSPV